MPTRQTQNGLSHAKRVLSEDALSIRDSLGFVEDCTGKAVDRTVLHRWIHRGRKGIKLEAVQLGREWITSKQALTRFIEQTRRKPQ